MRTRRRRTSDTEFHRKGRGGRKEFLLNPTLSFSMVREFYLNDGGRLG